MNTPDDERADLLGRLIHIRDDGPPGTTRYPMEERDAPQDDGYNVLPDQEPEGL